SRRRNPRRQLKDHHPVSDVAEVWRECLGVEEDFGPQDDFFDVGGSSSTITTVAGLAKALQEDTRR
ncbi:phosphopantetheine-binding protein, partial [Streptomyces mirabilis]